MVKLIEKTFVNMQRYSLNKSEIKRRPIKNKWFLKKQQNFNSTTSFLRTFCKYSTIHGLNFVGDKDTTPFEKKFWIFVLVTACCTLGYAILFLNFNNMGCELQTIIENTSYSVSDIPYPAVTICPTNRLDWSQFQNAEIKFLPKSATIETKNLFRKFMLKFEQFRWEKFELFSEFNNVSLTVLDNINLRDIVNFMTISCEELFVSCKWVDEPIDCCKVFTKRTTEAGFCYTFNAVLTEKDKKLAKIGGNWPFRTTTDGINYGLYVKLHINSSKRSDNVYPESDAVLIRLHDTQELPKVTILIRKGVDQLLSIEPIYFETDEDAKSVDSSVRQCLFDDEKYDQLYFVLPGFKYTFFNCQRQCRNNYTGILCNCTLDIFFPLGNIRACTASDFHCLAKYDDILSRAKKSESDIGNGMICYCLQNCRIAKYYLTATTMENMNTTKDYITINTFYLADTLFKYRTSLARNWFDFLVYYGGIASFFLGSSLLSFVEILYFFTIHLAYYKYGSNKSNVQFVNSKIDYSNLMGERIKTIKEK